MTADHDHRDPLIDWLACHPLTMVYIAVVVTANFVLNLLQVT